MKQTKNYLNLIAASCFLIFSVFCYSTASSMPQGGECWSCVSGNCIDGASSGWNACGEGPEFNCSFWGGSCACPDPTVPCEN